MRFGGTLPWHDSKVLAWSTQDRAGGVGAFERTEYIEPLNEHALSTQIMCGFRSNDDNRAGQIHEER